jgi:predicted PurR-regulated permease PerM
MFAKLRDALLRAALHIILAFFIAFVVVAALVEGAAFLSNNVGPGSLAIAIVAGLIIAFIAGFIALIVEAVRGVEAGVHEVEEGVGHVAQGIDSAAHHDQQQK